MTKNTPGAYLIAISTISLAISLPSLAGTGIADTDADTETDTEATTSPWLYGFDLRTGFYDSGQESRSGETNNDSSWRARMRLSVQRPLGEDWSLRTRIAGSYSTAQEHSGVYLRGYAPTRSGIRTGDTTLDELHLNWAPAHAEWSLRFGRFQSQANLPIVPGKGLDRKDSSNVGVSWTDGIQLNYPIAAGWQGETRLHYNHRKGRGSVHRAPMDYSDAGSRIGLTQRIQNNQALGPLFMRRITLSWEPDSLASHGLADPRREDYLALTAASAARWPIRDSGSDFVLAGEIGRVKNTPLATVTNSGDQGRAGANAWQLSANLENFAPNHRIGIVYGQADAGWLHSIDYRNNGSLLEVRHQYRFNPRWSMETRLRAREELNVPSTAEGKQRSMDIYMRVTARLGG